MSYSISILVSRLLFFALLSPLCGCGVTLSLPALWKSDPPPTEMKRDVSKSKEDDIITPEKPSDKDLITGSVTPREIKVDKSQPNFLNNEDWLHTKNAVLSAVTIQDDQPSQAWENDAGGSRGTVTLTSKPFTHNVNTCRNFLGSVMVGDKDNWFEGKVCKNLTHPWQISEITPWKKKL